MRNNIAISIVIVNFIIVFGAFAGTFKDNFDGGKLDKKKKAKFHANSCDKIRGLHNLENLWQSKYFLTKRRDKRLKGGLINWQTLLKLLLDREGKMLF